MTDMICWLIGGLITISVYLILSAQMMRWLFGIVILNSTINLVIFIAGRLYSPYPPFIPQGKQVADVVLSNPLSQALILTAIVIGFGLLAFALILLRKVWRTFNTTNTDLLRFSETHLFQKVKEPQ
ncbi:MAG: NADH-quinone oxidoreductase subunit K [Gammaproteobacteria bacterium]|nr:NADH-quinone oxidoreductase subunit K [Gammaproteobacteria bacterium]MCW5583480.1 NADH-quinone oxidoreductase subunit K [Gammaproteobacteria bacterium]